MPLTWPRLRVSSWSPSICSLSPGPCSLERVGFLSSCVRKSWGLSLCSVRPRSFLVNSSARRKRDRLLEGKFTCTGLRAEVGRTGQSPPRVDGNGQHRRGHAPSYVGTGLSCWCRCHSELRCHHRWTWVPRRLPWGEAARHCPSGLPSSSSCAGGRRARTPHPASDTLHLEDRTGHCPVLSMSPCPPDPRAPTHCVQTGDGTEMPSAQSLPGEEGGQWGCGPRGKMLLQADLFWPQPGSRKQRLGGHRGAWGSTAAWPGSRASLSPGGD